MGQSMQKVQWPKSLPIKMPESACSVYGSCWLGKWHGATVPIGSNFTQCGESDSTHAHQRSSCKDCQAHDVQVSVRRRWCLWSSAGAQEHPSAGHWPQSYTADVLDNWQNQTSSSHKPTSEQEAVSNGTEEAYPKTDRKAKLQQTCKRPGPAPNQTTCVLPAPEETEVEKGDGPKQEGWTFLHHWRRHWWCVPKAETECAFDKHPELMFRNQRTRRVTASRARKNLRVSGRAWTLHRPPVHQTLKSHPVHWIHQRVHSEHVANQSGWATTTLTFNIPTNWTHWSWKSSFVLDQTFICSLIYDKALFCL